MKYSVSDEGIKALRETSYSVSGALLQIEHLTGIISEISDRYENTLGPHKKSLDGVVTEIQQEQSSAAEPAQSVAGVLLEIAAAYQEIVSNDLFSSGLTVSGVNPPGASSGSGGGSLGSTQMSDNAAQNMHNSIRQSGTQWVSGLSEQEKSAVVAYTGTAYGNINATLRGMEKDFEPGNREFAKNLHEALSRAQIPTDCTVYRGVSSKALGKLAQLPNEALPGKMFGDYGFVSTSILPENAFGGDVLLEIAVPKGTHGAYVGDISSVGHYESEVLLDAGQVMKITGVRNGQSGKRIISVMLK